MRTRTPGLFLLLISLLVGSLGSLVAVAATPGTADACSIAGPHAEVHPSTNLRPGQQIEITGWSFIDVTFTEPQSPAVVSPDATVALPPPLCDFDVFPLDAVRVIWQGPTISGEPNTLLGVVSGPDFKLTATVPKNAVTGPAAIVAGPVTISVMVGEITPPPPPPCPLATTDAAASYQAATQPGADHTPGFLPACPPPCDGYAHTTATGTEYDYRWDCPDPCGYEANPGAALTEPPAEAAVWCPPPPPVPCPLYDAPMPAGSEPPAEAAVWCPPPPPVPCPLYPDGDVVIQGFVDCPPEPCPLYRAAVQPGSPEPLPWCPEPWPCPVYLQGDVPDVPDAPEPLIACPDPCSLVGGDAVWCPPPCYGEATDRAIACPAPPPVVIQPGVATAEAASATEPVLNENESAPAATTRQPLISFGEPASAPGAPTVSFVVASVARQMVAAIQGAVANLVG